jgi:hypothetical protein
VFVILMVVKVPVLSLVVVAFVDSTNLLVSLEVTIVVVVTQLPLDTTKKSHMYIVETIFPCSLSLNPK